MFRGINAINLDTKGRFAVPTKYRDRLQQDCLGRLVLTIDTEANCLLLYPLPEWEVIEAKLQKLPSFNPAARRVQRLLIGHATDVELDSNGRLLVAPMLREYANLSKKVVLIGQGNKFEIWDEDNWNAGRDSLLAESGQDKNGLPEDLENIAL